jgi:hypothetical protein
VDLGFDWKEAPNEVRKFYEELQAVRLALSDVLGRLVVKFDGAFDGGNSLLLQELGPNAPADSISFRVESRKKLFSRSCSGACLVKCHS